MVDNTAIQLRRSNVPGKVPTVDQLLDGELAINVHDGKLFFRRDANGVMSIVEVGVDASGVTRVCIDPRYYRPNEVNDLRGDPSKANGDLRWKPTISFEELIREMVQHDCEEEGYVK